MNCMFLTVIHRSTFSHSVCLVIKVGCIRLGYLNSAGHVTKIFGILASYIISSDSEC